MGFVVAEHLTPCVLSASNELEEATSFSKGEGVSEAGTRGSLMNQVALERRTEGRGWMTILLVYQSTTPPSSRLDFQALFNYP